MEALMLRITRVLAVAFTLFAVALVAQARAEKDEKTLKGTVTCAKCDLKLQKDKCATVVKVKGDNGKDIVYWFDEAGHKKYHGKICTTPTEGTVVGKVAEKNGKWWVTVTKVDWKK